MTWKKQEAGWYTSELGGICKERNGKWYFYPIEIKEDIFTNRSGPFTTLAVARKFIIQREKSK